MKNNKNGFTLVEVLICIGLLSAIMVVVSFSMSETSKKSQFKTEKATLEEVLNAAKLYSTYNIDCDNCDNITINDLVLAGLIDKNITTKKNPLSEDNFLETDIIVIETKDGIKDSYLEGHRNYSLNELDNINNWSD